MAWPAEFTIKVRRDSSAAWTDANPTLAQGEIGWETDTRLEKIGDGLTAWNDLPCRGSLFYSATSGTNLDLDARIPGARRHTMDGNTTITLGDGPTGRSLTITLALEQDATGGRTVTWPAGIRWLAGAAPTLGTAAGALTLVELRWIGEWIGRALA